MLGTLPLVFLAELGIAVALGVMLDTMIVRSVLVTALNLDLGSRIWWPSKLDRGDARGPAPDATGPASRSTVSVCRARGPGARGPRAAGPTSLSRVSDAADTPSRYAARWPAPSAAPPSTSARRPRCWPRAATTSTACARPRPGSATRAWSPPAGPGVVTYSPKVFIPLTRLCRDRCHYCTFVTTPGQLSVPGRRRTCRPTRSSTSPAQGAALGCLEALFTLGDRPEDRWPEAREWLDEQGYDSTLAYVRAMAVRVLEETGLLPHLNPGVMSWEEMNRLKPVAPSMGMMLETTSRRLFEDRRARRTSAPPTRTRPSGCGCSRTPAGSRSRSPPACWSASARRSTERAETIFALRADRPAATAHVQEVIVQNFRAKPDTAMRHADDLGLDEYLAAIAVTRLVLGPEGARAGAAEPRRPRRSAARCSTPASTTGAASPRSPPTT